MAEEASALLGHLMGLNGGTVATPRSRHPSRHPGRRHADALGFQVEGPRAPVPPLVSLRLSVHLSRSRAAALAPLKPSCCLLGPCTARWSCGI